MTDKETLDTLEAASKAQDTGDGKRQVFTADASKGEHPEPPYDTGDLWFNGEDILVCTVARTACDKYNASDWVKKDSYASKDDMKNYVDGVTKDMQDQIDSKAEQHFYAYDPTLDNEPAKSWTTDEEKEKHVDDLFYNTETGKAYRFMKGDDGSYKWELVQDKDVTNALEAASKAQDTADGKRRVFTADASKDEHPDPPYDEGDLWYTGAEVLVCGKSKAKGEAYDAGDWGKKDNYTNKDEVVDAVDKKLTQEDIFNRLTNNGASQGMFIEDGNVYFNASYIATGMLTSQNKNSVYNLADGTFTITNEHSDPAPNVVTKTVLTPDGLEVYTANNLSFELKNHHNQNLGDWARMKLGDDNNYIIFDLHFEVRWKGVRENPLCWLDDDFKPASRGVILWANANQHSVQVDKQEAAEEPKVEPAVKKTVTKAITLNNGKWNVRKGAGMQYQSIGVISSPNAKTGKPVCIGYETVVNGWFKTVYGYISQKAVKSHT